MSTPKPMQMLPLLVCEDGTILLSQHGNNPRTQELVATSEIAMMANVSRGAVSNWATKNGTNRAIFPNPVVKLLGHDLYVKSDIETFLAEREA